MASDPHIPVTVDDLRTFAAYAGPDPTTRFVARVAKAGLDEIEYLRSTEAAHVKAVERAHAREGKAKAEVEQLRARYDLVMTRVSAAIEHADSEGNDVKIMRDILWPPNDTDADALGEETQDGQ